MTSLMTKATVSVSRFVRDAGSGFALSWARLGEPSALSPLVTLLYLPFGFVGPLFIDRSRLGGGWASWLLVAVAGQLAVTVVFLAGRALQRRGEQRWRPEFTLGVLMVAALLRASVLDQLAFALNLIPSLEVGYRIGAALLTQTGVLLTMALIVSSFVNHQTVAARLQTEAARLADLNDTMRDRIAEIRQQLTAEVHLTVDPLISRLDAALGGLDAGGDAADVRESIREIVDDQLRPLSHRLAASAEPIVEPVDVEPFVRTWRAPLPSPVRLSLILRPLAVSALVALLAASPALRELQPPHVFIFPLLSGALVGAVVLLVRFVAGRVQVHLGLGVFLASALAGMALWLSYLIERALAVPVPPHTLQAAIVSVTLIGGLTAMYAAVNERRSVTEEQLRALVEERRTRLSMLRQHAFVARRELSYVLHGSVQSSLHAAAMRLSAVEHPDGHLVSSIRRDIADATARLDAPVSPDVLLVDTLADIAELWDGTCTVRWTLDHRTVRLLVDSPSAAACVAEIARECVANAIRHGRASDVWVTIARADDRVVVSVLDNGCGINAAAVRGLGSTMLDEMCVAWHQEPQAPGTKVVAEIAAVTAN